MAEEGGESHPWMVQTSDSHEGCLGLCQAFGKMGGHGEGQRKPVPPAPEFVLGPEDRAVKVDAGVRGRVPVPVRATLDQFSFEDGEADPQAGAPGFYHGVVSL